MGEESDRVGEVQDAVIVDVARIEARGNRLGEEEVAEEHQGVLDGHEAARVHVSAAERRLEDLDGSGVLRRGQTVAGAQDDDRFRGRYSDVAAEFQQRRSLQGIVQDVIGGDVQLVAGTWPERIVRAMYERRKLL